MINSTISINVILQEIVRDLNLGNEPIDLADFKEWIIEGLKHIGVIAQYRKKREDVEIVDYEGDLPCDFYKLDKLIEGVMFTHNPDITFVKDSTLAEKRDQIVAVERTKQDINIVNKNILTTFQTGKVKILYWAFPLDKDGYLLLPDDISYKDALFWKVTYQLCLRGHKFAQIKLRDLDYTYRKWSFYVRQARGAGRMPDLELMERLKNDFQTLVINPNQYIDNFRHLGDRENIRLDNHIYATGGY